MKATYLDYAATAPMRPEIRQQLCRLLELPLGNASSLHRHGRQARMLLEQAREDVARVLGLKVEEVIFTAGATEANNLALMGWMRLQPPGSHLILSAIEHPSVWECAEQLAGEGYDVSQVSVDDQGRVDLEQLVAQLQPHTRLVSMMAVNNEVGVILPWAELAAQFPVGSRPWLLHVDAVQGAWVGWPSLQSVDLVTLSAHKLGGPIGSGCLLVRQGLRLAPQQLGGSQEDHRRAGTSNPLAAVGLASALQLVNPQEAERLKGLQHSLESQLKQLPGAHLLGARANRSPHISAWTFEGVDAEPLLVLLDLAGISASSGSACSSHSLEPSRVVAAMGYPPEQCRGLIRFSLGHATSEGDLHHLLERLPEMLQQVRQRSPR